MLEATGTFHIKMSPVDVAAGTPADAYGRMTIAKNYEGDIAGTGTGEMLGAMGLDASGAYVAMERIVGTLNGREGAFTVVHYGVVESGRQELSIIIVPGSGSGDLTGIKGVYRLDIADGVHRYMLQYELPDGAH